MPDSTSGGPQPTDPGGAVAVEQAAVTGMYQRLDELATRTQADIIRTRRSRTAGTPAAVVEREAMLRGMAGRLSALTSAERRLCFGRLDFATDRSEPLYIGRLSLATESQRLLLSDWRAPAAEPFYRATTAKPMGVVRRRHILLEGRRVSAVQDDVLDLSAVDEGHAFEGSGALMAALAAHRTGRMGDIVATIQAEQDQIIRAPLPGILLVEGGPGCGKTVVGLHRAAFLLYTHRDRIARSGVLVVGPNTLFLRYISQVLPGLGEASAVLATPGQLYPGVEARAVDPDAVAALKGEPRMADVISSAIRNRQRIPDSVKPLEVAGTRIKLTPAMASAARDRARASRKPHNAARVTFVVTLLDRLAAALATARRVDLETNRDVLLGDLRDSADVRREVNLCWLPITPEQLITTLWARPDLLAASAPHLSDSQLDLLRRDPGSPWTVADVPLLDEAAELLGNDEEPARQAAAMAAADRAAEEEYARGVIQMTGVGAGDHPITAAELMERYTGGGGSRMSAADAGLSDRSWAYGHVVVDEAQELSAMQWRLLMRRCPSKSMTVVGDLAQAGASAAPGSWADVFDRMAPGRWSLRRLTVNYRTPGPMMDLAVRVLLANGGTVTAPQSARGGPGARLVRAQEAGPEGVGAGRVPPVPRTASQLESEQEVAPDPYGAALAEAVRSELAKLLGEGGRAGVIAPVGILTGLAEGLRDWQPPGVIGIGDAALDSRVSLLSPSQAKGLEFDQVIVVEPAGIMAESARGAHDLYVCLTRATAELVVIHSRPLPPGFTDESG